MQQRAAKRPQPKKNGATKGSKAQPIYLALASITAEAAPQSQSLPFSLPLPPDVVRLLLGESARQSASCSSEEGLATGSREPASKAKRRPVATPVAPLHLGLSDQQLVQITQSRRKAAARAAQPGQSGLNKKVAAAPQSLVSPRKALGRAPMRQPLAPRDEALANLLGLSSLKPSLSTVSRIIDDTACLASGAARPRLAVGV